MTRSAQLSVVIPAWDIGVELSECIASVLADPEPCRLIVVDNASTRPLTLPEGTHVIRSPKRLSLGATRNLGLGEVSTPFVCFMDADDLLVRPALRLLVNALREDPDLVLAAGSILLWEPSSGRSARSYIPSRLAFRLQDRRRLLTLMQATNRVIPTQGAAVIRTQTLRELGGFPKIPHGENWALGVSLSLAGKVKLDPRPMKLYRIVSGDRTLSRQRDRSLRNALAARLATRRALRRSPDAGMLLRAYGFVLAPVHLALSVRDRLRRITPAERALRRAASSPIERDLYSEPLAISSGRTTRKPPR